MDNRLYTELGKIYYTYDSEKDEYKGLRVLNVNGDGTCEVIELSEDLKFDESYKSKTLTKDEHYNIKKNWNLLKSDGIVSITNLIALENEQSNIKDIICIFFPNNKITQYPDPRQMYVVARQAINNIFDITGNSVGLSVSLDTLPTGYSLSDFMEGTSVISSRLIHVYKIDNSTTLSILLNNEESCEILKDLHEKEVYSRMNSVIGFEDQYKENPDKYKYLNGYNADLKGFIKNTEFINDVLNIMGICIVDFSMESNKPIEGEDLLVLASLYGGIRIHKAVPMKFGYDIDLSLIKMSYLLVEDINEELWIVPYTKTPNEIDPDPIYNLTEEATSKLQERLINCVKAYQRED